MAIPGTAKLGPQLVKLARSFHCSTVKHAGSTWRLKHGLPENPSDRGLTTDLPDWSFADGRPAPPMAGHVRRLEKQREIVTGTRCSFTEVSRRPGNKTGFLLAKTTLEIIKPTPPPSLPGF
ncbi:large ribosomal subunit protein mL52 isoform X3 [Erythrolamprus reginae]|uniref:large ribosomal subunit protein mL52 isoform X3 n=1 Tax=Erythrolamprus reginae TaxID=121349 RepID=UPI00396C6A74